MSLNSGEIDDDNMVCEDACITCGGEVKEDETLQCDLYEVWEYLKYIKVCNRPSHECYVTLTQSICKSLVFTCTKCRHKGTVMLKV